MRSLIPLFTATMLAAWPAAGRHAVPSVEARRARLLEVLGPQAVTPADKAALVRKLGQLSARGPVRHDMDPGYHEQVACGVPCTTGTLNSPNAFFGIAVDCETGGFGLRTGPAHPATIAAGAPQDVTFEGSTLDTTGGEVTWFLHEAGMGLTRLPFGETCPFNPVDTADEPSSNGIEQEWALQPVANVNVLLRHELVAFGSTAANAGVRMTLSLTNETSSTETVTIGLRWWLDFMLAEDDGPIASAIQCSPLVVTGEWLVEHDIPAPDVDEFLRFRSNSGPAMEVSVMTRADAAFPGTAAPDRLVVARWANAFAAPWDYVASEGDATDSDAVLLYYFGDDLATGLTAAPGQTVTRSLVLLSDCDRSDTCQPPTFNAQAAPQPACDTDPISLSAVVTDPGSGSFTWRWSFGDGSPDQAVADPTIPVVHAYAGGNWTATLTATDTTSGTCLGIDTASVVVGTGVAPSGGMGNTLRVRRAGPLDVLVSWLGATVNPPRFIVFRTDTPSEGALTPTGIGDETIVAVTSAFLEVDENAVGAGPLLCYIVLPADSCDEPVYP